MLLSVGVVLATMGGIRRSAAVRKCALTNLENLLVQLIHARYH